MALKINSASGSITLTAEDGSGNADVTLPRAGFVSNLSDLSVTATAAELNFVDGVTSNIQTQLDAKGTVSSLSDLSITATATELNYVDGVTSNIQTQLDGKGTVSTLADLSVTATATELNLLDGVTATTAELNYVDGVTSNIQTQLDQKAASLTDLSVTATAAELNILDGATLTTTELNYVDGVTSAIQTQIDGKLSTSLKGAASGLAELDSSGLVPTSQLPSYVDDVLEYTNASSFPASGTTGKIYVALDTNDIYRWSGSAYVKVSDAVSTSDQATALATARTIALTGDVTGSTSFDGSANVSITATIADDSHNHVISNVDGLQTALDAKAPTASPTFTGDATFDTTTLVVDSTNNRIGVGTASPSAKVHSVDTNGNVLRLQRDGAFTGSWDVDIGSYTTGDFTIYDNENAQRAITIDKLTSFSGNSAMFINSGGNVLIGTQSTGAASGGSGTSGINLQSDGAVEIARSGNPAAFLNRTTSDGDIAQFRKDGSTVGSIGIETAGFTIDGEANHTGFRFGGLDVTPRRNGADVDATVLLGTSTNRFKELHLSGGVVENTTTVTYASSIALSYTNGSIQSVTLTGNVTFTDSLNDGEAIVLMLNGGASYTVTWTAVTKWVTGSGNAAPTLTANDTIVLWKIGSSVYAAYTGSYT